MHQCMTAVIPELYDMGCEAKLNFVNWYLQVVYAQDTDPMFLLLAMKLGFTSVDRNVSSINNRYWFAYNPTLICQVPLQKVMTGVRCAVSEYWAHSFFFSYGHKVTLISNTNLRQQTVNQSRFVFNQISYGPLPLAFSLTYSL
jgi:hypothetical protein